MMPHTHTMAVAMFKSTAAAKERCRDVHGLFFRTAIALRSNRLSARARLVVWGAKIKKCSYIYFWKIESACHHHSTAKQIELAPGETNSDTPTEQSTGVDRERKPGRVGGLTAVSREDLKCNVNFDFELKHQTRRKEEVCVRLDQRSSSHTPSDCLLPLPLAPFCCPAARGTQLGCTNTRRSQGPTRIRGKELGPHTSNLSLLSLEVIAAMCLDRAFFSRAQTPTVIFPSERVSLPIHWTFWPSHPFPISILQFVTNASYGGGGVGGSPSLGCSPPTAFFETAVLWPLQWCRRRGTFVSPIETTAIADRSVEVGMSLCGKWVVVIADGLRNANTEALPQPSLASSSTGLYADQQTGERRAERDQDCKRACPARGALLRSTMNTGIPVSADWSSSGHCA